MSVFIFAFSSFQLYRSTTLSIIKIVVGVIKKRKKNSSKRWDAEGSPTATP